MFGCIRRRRRRGLIIQVLWLLVRKVNKLMKDVADLDAAIADLKQTVAAIVIPTPTPVDLQTQVDAISGIKADIVAKFPPAPPAA